MSKTVEFLGMQGAGKSTLVRTLAQREGYKTIPQGFGWKRYACLFLLLHPYFSCAWMVTILRESADLSVIRYKLYMFLVKAGRWQYVQQQSGEDIYLLDESFLLASMALYERELDEKAIRRWLRIMPKSDVAVFAQRANDAYDKTLHVSDELARLGPEGVRRWQSILTSNCAILRSILEQEHLLPVLSCISDDPAACDAAIRSAGSMYNR